MSESTPAEGANLNVPLPECVVSPELTEGPYFVDEGLHRSDIRSNPSDGSVRDGTLLELALRVFQVRGNDCTALEGAMVDIWHCDALGVYSDVRDPGFNTTGQQFLRGYQVTDATGSVQFTTIYPGWYEGRTVHIHFKIRTLDAGGRQHELTSQLFFDDALTDRIHSGQPYASKGMRTLGNNGDGIYHEGGDQLLLQLTSTDEGYTATFDIGLRLD